MLRLRPTLSTPLEYPGALSHPLNGTVLWAASGTWTAGVATHAPDAAWPAPDPVQVMATTATEAMPRLTKRLLLIRNLLLRTTRRGNPTLGRAPTATANRNLRCRSGPVPSRRPGDSTIFLCAPLTMRRNGWERFRRPSRSCWKP